MSKSTTLQHPMVDLVQVGEPTGRSMLDGAHCQYADEVMPGDLVSANFDVKHIHSGGGLYLLHATDGSNWHGCRRMMRVPDGIDIDQDGRGNWVKVPDMDSINWRVVGIVETVYKPTRYQ